MTPDPETCAPDGPALLAAAAVALSARCGRLQPHQVYILTARAADLPAEDPLRGVAMLFASHYPAHRRDPEALASLGEELDRGIRRALAPATVGAGRRDIHG